MKALLKQTLEYLPQMRKALVSGLVAAALWQLGRYGVSADMTVGQALELLSTGVVSGGTVWLVRNGSK